MARGGNNNHRGGRGRGSPMPNRGGGRGGRGRGGNRGGNFRGRARGGYRPMDEVEIDIQLYNGPSTPPYRGFDSPRGRGGRGTFNTPGGYDSGRNTPRGGFPGRGRGLIDTFERPGSEGRGRDRGFGRRLQAKLGAGAPLSKVLNEDRPYLKPIVFVRSVYTATLFKEEHAEDILNAIVEDVADTEAAHVPTAKHVDRVFGTGGEPSQSDSEKEGDEEEDIEEYDFADMSRLKEELDAAAAQQAVPRTSQINATQQDFTGFWIDTTPVVQSTYTQPHAQHGAGRPAFFVDTTPMPSHAAGCVGVDVDRVSGDALGLPSPDDEIIVYVAPHPRSHQSTSQAPKLDADAETELAPVPTTSVLTGTTQLLSDTKPDIHERMRTPPPDPPTVADIKFTVLGTPNAPSRTSRGPRPLRTPRAAVIGSKVFKRRTRNAGQRKFGFGMMGAALEEQQLRLEQEERMRGDPRKGEQRRGDSDVDWGDDVSAEEDVGTGDMQVDDGLDGEAMARFVTGMKKGGGEWVTMDDVADVQKLRQEDEEQEAGRGSSGEDEGAASDGADSDEEGKEMDAVFDAEEKVLIAEEGVHGPAGTDSREAVVGEGEEAEDHDGDGDDDETESSDDDVDVSPKSSFQARLERLRQKSRGKKIVSQDDFEESEGEDGEDWSSDDGRDDFDSRFTWAERDEDLIQGIQTLLEENEGILHGRDRKAKKEIFRAICDGNLEGIAEPSRRKKDQWKDLPPELQAQWKKDREKKAERKRMREALRLEEAVDPLAPKKGGKKGRKASKRAAALGLDIPNAVVDLASLETQIRRFITNLGQNSMALPPMDKESRKRVHELAGAFNLKSQSKGQGSGRYTTLIRTSMTGVAIKEKKVRALVRRNGGGEDRFNAPNGFRGGGRAPKHREGDEVGKAAPKISASNMGFQLLAKMGWSEGQRIGVSGGLAAPLTAVIKTTKLGLGATR